LGKHVLEIEDIEKESFAGFLDSKFLVLFISTMEISFPSKVY
jgi:hypothetical protein